MIINSTFMKTLITLSIVPSTLSCDLLQQPTHEKEFTQNEEMQRIQKGNQGKISCFNNVENKANSITFKQLNDTLISYSKELKGTSSTKTACTIALLQAVDSENVFSVGGLSSTQLQNKGCSDSFIASALSKQAFRSCFQTGRTL